MRDFEAGDSRSLSKGVPRLRDVDDERRRKDDAASRSRHLTVTFL